MYSATVQSARIGVAVDQRRARIHVAPAQHVDRKVVLYGRAQDPVEARVVRLALRLLRHYDADADRRACLLSRVGKEELRPRSTKKATSASVTGDRFWLSTAGHPGRGLELADQ